MPFLTPRISVTTFLRSGIALAVLVCLLPPEASEAEEPVVADLIAQLESEAPEDRDLAIRELEDAGLTALEAVAEAATSGSAETTSVALSVLRSWLDSSDGDLSSGAQEKVAQLVNRWIVELDSDLYDERKIAQQKLELAGLPALEAVGAEAESGSLESSTRALNVMLSWGESDNNDLQVAALEKLVTLQNRPVESKKAADLLADAREEATLEALAKLGVRHTIDERVGRVLPNQPYLHLIIDEEWKGELEDLELLSAVRRAHKVSLYSVPLDEEVLKYLAVVPNVRVIELFGTDISQENATEFDNKNPAIRVDYRRSAALLGIRGQALVQGPVVIESVSKESAAEEAGLKRNDAITELNGEKVLDFKDLTKRISQFQPGDSAELSILRNGKLMKKTVTFHRWDSKAWENNAGVPRNLPAVQGRPLVPQNRPLKSPSLDRR